MILDLFIVLLALAVVALVLGYFTGDSVYAFIGLAFLFILGTYLFTNNVEYETGSIVSTNYTYNGTQVLSQSTTVTYVNTSFSGTNARWFGVLLSVLGGLGMSLAFWNYRRTKKGED